MKWFYGSGIILLYFVLVNSEYNQDCLVNNFYKKEYWSGDELVFFAYVTDKETGVVNIKLTYEGLKESSFFTTFYFSPSAKYSKRMETKNEEDIIYSLDAMESENGLVEFKISSHKGTINVMYEPNTNEHFFINQTTHTFKDLIIRASNISSCKEGRKWEVCEGSQTTIPLGGEAMDNPYHLQFTSSYSIKPVLRISNYSAILNSNEYTLTIEKSEITLYSLKDQRVIKSLYISQNVTTIDIFSKSGNFTVTVNFGATHLLPSSSTTPKPVTHKVVCSTCYDTIWKSTLIPLLVISIIISIIIGIGFRYKTFLLRIPFTSKNKEENGNLGTELKSISRNGKREDVDPSPLLKV